MNMRLHAFEPFSRANGPGLRAVVWFQGCTLGCPGCFNPATHDPMGGYAYDTAQLAGDILDLGSRIEGISISGGEPLQQPEALLDLLQLLGNSTLSNLLFSGFSLEEIKALPSGPSILGRVDVLIAGRYYKDKRLGKNLLGSGNQQIHLLTDRYGKEELVRVPTRELVLHRDGSTTASGLIPWWKQRYHSHLHPFPEVKESPTSLGPIPNIVIVPHRLKLLQPRPADAASNEIIGKIRPTEAGSQNRSADEIASQVFEKGRVPQLKKFQAARHDQHDGHDYTDSQPSPEEVDYQTPEDLVEYSAQRVSDPALSAT